MAGPASLPEHILRTLDGIKTLPADFFEVSSAAPATAP
ncbi:hypothetical protein BN940_17531 [Castellaniella defragrans 65Phen]|uniref:Uncharacterized protein n=1 Tax=Castellaniella defragrans (strain DSM 12143 / CCUG 39792 / 65Phen) TaxID=1437824 RepID=W8X1W6_CASD6|nr:hypothetical protein BN940_17531 [Castellaniella defragrans 65Phen]